MSLRRFFANPHEAVEQALPAIIPKVNDIKAIKTKITPSNNNSLNSQPARILLTNLATIKGIIHSITTSHET